MEELAVIQFDGWSLHTDSGELSRGTIKARLQEQSLQFLLELLEHPGQVVTREQLIARLWPKGVVDFDTSLNSVVRKLRVALGDNATSPRYIETIPRKGYRFICPLSSPQEPAVVPEIQRTLADSARTVPPHTEPSVSARSEVSPVMPQVLEKPAAPSWRVKRRIYALILIVLFAVTGVVIAAVLAMRTEGEKPAVIAVLPLVNMSSEPDDALLSDGLTEELSTALSQVPGLQVIARTSAFAFKDTVTDLAEIRRRLRATHVIEGSLERKSSALRVTVRLVTTGDGVERWTGSFDIDATDRLHIQEWVIIAVADELGLQLEPQTQEGMVFPETKSRLASEYRLKAREFWRKRTQDANHSAIELYRKAILADRNYALAYVGLAEAHLNQIHLEDMPVEKAADLAAPQIQKALELSRRLPEALAANGWLLAEQSHLEAAAKLLQEASASRPNDAGMRGMLAQVLSRLGQPQRALAQHQRAAALDPLDPIIHVQQCFILQDLADFDAADVECKLAEDLQRDSPWGYFATAHLWRNRGRLDEALRASQRVLQRDPGRPVFLTWHIELQLMLGLNDEAEDTHRRSVRVSPGGYDRSLVGILLVREGREALLEYLQSVDPDLITSPGDLVDLAKAYHLAGDSATAARLFVRAEQTGLQRAYLLDPREVANEYSGALYLAAVHLANGERVAGNAKLDALEAMLDRLEAAGVDCHGLHSLRAQAQALRGNHDAAMVSLQRALKRGWLWTWRAQHEPYLAPLREREDYRMLIAQGEQEIARQRSAVEARRQGMSLGVTP